MRTDRWRRVRTLFEQARARPATARKALLDQIPDTDPELRALVENLLEADAGPSPLDRRWVDLPRALDTSPEPAPPATIGRYRILRKIGEGGMGKVYLAARDDQSFERRVVIKPARAGIDDENSHRLEQERRILARLEHPAIARLYDGGATENGIPFFVLEYVEGLPIDRHCQENKLDISERLALFRQVCAAVSYAHQNLVVHRDLKPSNILVTPGGEPQLLDFGIAKLLQPPHDMKATKRALASPFARPSRRPRPGAWSSSLTSPRSKPRCNTRSG